MSEAYLAWAAIVCRSYFEMAGFEVVLHEYQSPSATGTPASTSNTRILDDHPNQDVWCDLLHPQLHEVE